MRKALALTAAIAALAGPVLAQTAGPSIEVGTLDEARAFAPGIELSGALPADGWAGTSPDRAVRLLERMELGTDNPVARDMMRRVVLSGLAPPAGVGEDFAGARIRAAQALATPSEYERFARRNPAAMDPALRASAAIRAGNLEAACRVSDSIVEGRGEPDWVRLRAACHDLRGETAAAELARELLRLRGEATELDVPEPRDPFWSDIAELDAAGLDRFMDDLAAGAVDDSGLAGAAPDSGPIPLARDYDLADAQSDPSARGTARLYVLARDGDAAAVSAFAGRAAEAGLDPYETMSRIPAFLDPAEMVLADQPLFARYGVMTSDIALIQALFEVSEDETVRQRLALASDALGGGFAGRPMGEGLESGLESGAPRALTDALIALALGAELNETAEARLSAASLTEAGLSSPVTADWIAIDQAVDRGARAETLLRLASQLEAQSVPDGGALYRTLRALRATGFDDLAAQLAALEFLRDL